MNRSELIAKIKSFGAFIPQKFYNLFNEEHTKFGEEIFREHQDDISLSTGGLYLAMTLPVREYWADLVKEHFRRLKNLQPRNAIEINNKAFSYDTFGFYRDPSDKNEKWKRIADHFGIDGFRRGIQPIYEEAIAEEPKLWEPRYNLAEGLLHLWSWREDPVNDPLDYERAFEELTTILEIDPKNIFARLRLTGPFHDFVDVYTLYKEILEIDPTNEKAIKYFEDFKKDIKASLPKN